MLLAVRPVPDAPTHCLTIPSATRHLSTVRRFVTERAEAEGLPEETVQALRLAAEEACANIIEHAYAGDASREIDVAIVTDDERFAIRVCDEGTSFQPGTYAAPDVCDLAQQRQSGGLGVHLMHRLMDGVEYRTYPSGTNEVTLTAYRNRPQAG